MSGTRAAQLAARLAGTRFADSLTWLDLTGSTIDAVRAELARAEEAGAPAACPVVLADAQSRGRGQEGRAWHSPRGLGLYVSAVIRPPIPPQEALVLTPLAGLCALDALAIDLQVSSARLKRPNDLVVPAPPGAPSPWRKIGGVIVDTAVQGPTLRHAIVSLGLNLGQRPADFPAALAGHATSLAVEAGATLSVVEAAAAFLLRLDAAAGDLEGSGRARALIALSERYSASALDLPHVRFPRLAGPHP